MWSKTHCKRQEKNTICQQKKQQQQNIVNYNRSFTREQHNDLKHISRCIAVRLLLMVRHHQPLVEQILKTERWKNPVFYLLYCLVYSISFRLFLVLPFICSLTNFIMMPFIDFFPLSFSFFFYIYYVINFYYKIYLKESNIIYQAILLWFHLLNQKPKKRNQHLFQ